jgi:quinol monooxygenase YgiN
MVQWRPICASALIQTPWWPDMLINSIHYTFAPKDAELAESLFRQLRDASRKEPGVVQFDVGQSREKPNVFALWEVYRDQEAVDAHAASEHFQRLVVNGVRPLAQGRNIEKVVPI